MSGGEFANALFRLSVKAQIVHFTFKTLTATIQAEIELPIRERSTGGFFLCSPLWRDSRGFRISKTPNEGPKLVQTGENERRITLGWSHEALAEAAYEMTFWYMGKVGERIFSERKPKEWSEMTPSEVGRNAIKMMLYYAILRCRTLWEFRRAVELHNVYGFGYTLGKSFRDKNGRRDMLWAEDLEEIAATGITKHGKTIGG